MRDGEDPPPPRNQENEKNRNQENEKNRNQENERERRLLVSLKPIGFRSAINRGYWSATNQRVTGQL